MKTILKKRKRKKKRKKPRTTKTKAEKSCQKKRSRRSWKFCFLYSLATNSDVKNLISNPLAFYFFYFFFPPFVPFTLRRAHRAFDRKLKFEPNIRTKTLFSPLIVRRRINFPLLLPIFLIPLSLASLLTFKRQRRIVRAMKFLLQTSY